MRGNIVYFFGGANNHDISDSSSTPATLSNTVNVFNTVSHTWSTVLPMPTAKMWATAQFLDGQFHVLGGLNSRSEQLDEHAIYTP